MSKEDEPEPVNLTPMVPMTKKFKVEHESDQLFIRFGQPPPLNCGQALANALKSFKIECTSARAANDIPHDPMWDKFPVLQYQHTHGFYKPKNEWQLRSWLKFEKLGELSGDQVRRQAFQRILASSRFDKAGLTNVNCLKLEFDDERKTRLFVTIDNSQTLQQRQQERPPIS